MLDFTFAFENSTRVATVHRSTKNAAPEGRNIIAQHGAVGGVLGQVEIERESPGDDTGFHAQTSAPVRALCIDAGL